MLSTSRPTTTTATTEPPKKSDRTPLAATQGPGLGRGLCVSRETHRRHEANQKAWFHVKPGGRRVLDVIPEQPDAVRRVVRWLGRSLDDRQAQTLERYQEWLATEGIGIGGIGPSERNRLWSRHLADSLAFAVGVRGGASIADVGSGVGLPGLPLAVALPDCSVTLIERSGRRADALRRIAVVLDCPVTVVHADVRNHRTTYDRVVSRATFPPEDAAQTLVDLVAPDGDMVLGLGHHPDDERLRTWAATPLPRGWVATVISVPADILDSAPALLRIAAT